MLNLYKQEHLLGVRWPNLWGNTFLQNAPNQQINVCVMIYSILLDVRDARDVGTLFKCIGGCCHIGIKFKNCHIHCEICKILAFEICTSFGGSAARKSMQSLGCSLILTDCHLHIYTYIHIYILGYIYIYKYK